MSIKIKLLFITIGSILITTILLSILNIVGLNNFEQEIKKNILESKQNELKTLTKLSTQILETYYEKTKKENVESTIKEKLTFQMDSLVTIVNHPTLNGEAS